MSIRALQHVTTLQAPAMVHLTAETSHWLISPPKDAIRLERVEIYPWEADKVTALHGDVDALR